MESAFCCIWNAYLFLKVLPYIKHVSTDRKLLTDYRVKDCIDLRSVKISIYPFSISSNSVHSMP